MATTSNGEDYIVIKTIRVGYPLTDSEIIRLLEELPDNDIGKCWQFGIKLISTYQRRWTCWFTPD